MLLLILIASRIFTDPQTHIKYTLFDEDNSACVGDASITGRVNALDSCDENPLKINIPETVTDSKTYTVVSISNYAFYRCPLSDITLPSSIKYIGESAFDITYAASINDFSENLEYIDEWAFSLTKIPKFHIPNSLKYIGSGAFGCNTQLSEITITENPKYFTLDKQKILYNIDLTKLIRAPVKLATITIPKTVKEIMASAFSGCEITELIIPISVKIIEKQFVDLCAQLQKIYIYGNIKSIERLISTPRPGLEVFYYQGSIPIENNIFEYMTSTPKNIQVCQGYLGNTLGNQTFSTGKCQAIPIEKIFSCHSKHFYKYSNFLLIALIY